MPNTPGAHTQQLSRGLTSRERWMAQAILMTLPREQAWQEAGPNADAVSPSLPAELEAQARAFLGEARRARDEALADRRRAAQELAQALETAARTEALCRRAQLAFSRRSSTQARPQGGVKAEASPRSPAPAAA